MTGVGPTSERPQEAPASPTHPPAPSPAVERATRMSAANMVRSLVPLVLICLVLVAWQAFRNSGEETVREVDPAGSVQLAAARASYPMVAPTGLPEGYRPTSARTDAGGAEAGAPVTLEVGYLTPEEEYAGFVVSDDEGGEVLTGILAGAEEQGTVEVGGQTWTRSTTERGETALSREADGVTVVVTGSADDEELETVAGAVTPVVG
ncbi:DUF4245 domain-containing protein [Geodermatophilus ruber]|uniref:DUF4245 domain-containing protein n=1 Tax=Geodermatophilus ruber TaxID=504800 RepID=A0A1I4G0J9_9ACTN|nr:DUF4245 domain-containing protein [Geodermatophilus ruber]SFL23625.1 Protein of unknown function [Geodermatophilus ruber]